MNASLKETVSALAAEWIEMPCLVHWPPASFVSALAAEWIEIAVPWYHSS